VSEWQPIETAPKDGTYIWLARPGTMRIGWWASGEKYECHGSIGGGWRDHALSDTLGGARDLTYAPTHWQPVPEPPQ
jgi:hypothetical protein